MTPKTQSVCKHCQQPKGDLVHSRWAAPELHHEFEPVAEPASTGEQPLTELIDQYWGPPLKSFEPARPSEPSVPQTSAELTCPHGFGPEQTCIECEPAYPNQFTAAPQPVSGDAPEPFDIRDGKHRYSPCIRCGANLGMGLSCDSAGVFVRCTACSFTGPNAKSDKEAFELWNSLANADPAPSPTPSVSTEPTAPLLDTETFLSPLTQLACAISQLSNDQYRKKEIISIADAEKLITGYLGKNVGRMSAPSVAGMQPTPEERELLLAQFFPQGTPQVEEKK